MRTTIIALAATTTALVFTSTAMACAPLLYRDQITGETYPADSPRGWAREQAELRARSDAVFIAQVSAGRLARDNQLIFTLTPISSVDGSTLPDAALVERRYWGQTCDDPLLAVGDYVIVYAGRDHGVWAVRGLYSLDQLQDAPPEFRRRIREIHRGLIPGPTYPE